MDPRFIGIFDRFPGPLDILFLGAGQRTDDGAFYLLGDSFDRFKVTRRGDGKPGFDRVNTQLGQLTGDLHLFFGIKRGSRTLLAVP